MKNPHDPDEQDLRATAAEDEAAGMSPMIREAQTISRRAETLRLVAIEWLARNDANGEYRDSDATANGWDPLTLAQALDMIREALDEGAVQGGES